MSQMIERIVKTNGISLNVVEQGQGPLVLMCHGFPESWYSWRHQMDALAAAGFRAVAPDMRGYGKSDRPEAIDQYTMLPFGRRSRRSCWTGSRRLARSLSAMTGAPPSPGKRRACVRTASARSSASASPIGRAVQPTRPA